MWVPRAIISAMCLAAICSIAFADLTPALVATPSGMVPHYCVHSVFSGATVHPISGGNLRISHPDLAKDIFIQANPDCLKYGYGRVKAEVVDESAYDYPVVGAPIWPEPFGQTLYTETKTSSADPFTSFSTNWNVPLSPWWYDREIMFLFNALEAQTAAGLATLQPAVQWGKAAPGGGQYWSFASWYTDQYGNYVYSPWQSGYYAINEKDNVIGNMTQLNNGTWFIGTTDTTTKVSSSILVSANVPITTATVGISCFQYSACWELPSGPSVTFDNIKMSTGKPTNRKPFTANWKGIMQGVCGEDYTIHAPNKVTLSWTPGTP